MFYRLKIAMMGLMMISATGGMLSLRADFLGIGRAFSDVAQIVSHPEAAANQALAPIRQGLQALSVQAVNDGHDRLVPLMRQKIAEFETNVHKSMQAQINQRVPNSIGPVSLVSIKTKVISEADTVIREGVDRISKFVLAKIEEMIPTIQQLLCDKIDEKVRIGQAPSINRKPGQQSDANAADEKQKYLNTAASNSKGSTKDQGTTKALSTESKGKENKQSPDAKPQAK